MQSNDNIVITGGNLIVDTVTNITPAASFPLPASDLESLGFRKGQIDRLIANGVTQGGRRLQNALAPELSAVLADSFAFAGGDCETLTERVVQAWCNKTVPPT